MVMEVDYDSDPRLQWIIQLRKEFSPQDMLNPDGTIRQEFFRPKKQTLVQEKVWGTAEQSALLSGLQEHGVGSWREIRERHLPGWQDQQLRVRTCRLLGSQSLARYVGWKGNKEAVDAERERNKAIGMETGCWKSGLLVENDKGALAQYFAAQQRQ